MLKEEKNNQLPIYPVDTQIKFIDDDTYNNLKRDHITLNELNKLMQGSRVLDVDPIYWGGKYREQDISDFEMLIETEVGKRFLVSMGVILETSENDYPYIGSTVARLD